LKERKLLRIFHSKIKVMLKRQIIIYDDGRKTDEIFFTDGTSPSIIYPQRDGIRDAFLTTFKYKVKLEPGDVLAIVRFLDKVVIMPSGKEVHPKTTLEDIDVIEKKPTPPPKPKSYTFKSSTSNDIYNVRFLNGKYVCNCSGFFRVKDKDKGCKHVQEVKSTLKVK